MEESIFQIAEQIKQLHKKAYDVCRRKVSEMELSYLLDYLLDFACDEKMLELYKKVFRRYFYTYPSFIKSYIVAYREMLKDENE